MTAPHKLHRFYSERLHRAACTCGWVARGDTSAQVSLAVAAHRNANGGAKS